MNRRLVALAAALGTAAALVRDQTVSFAQAIVSQDSARTNSEDWNNKQWLLYQKRAVPAITQLQDSQERRNLWRRLERFNDPSKIGYVYLFLYGVAQPIGYYTIKGKLSSVNSLLTSPNKAVGPSYSTGTSLATVDEPQLDGSFGTNDGAQFGFTDTDVYMQTNLQYLYTDQPLPINVPLFGAR